jgi:hypothetical protein
MPPVSSVLFFSAAHPWIPHRHMMDGKTMLVKLKTTTTTTTTNKQQSRNTGKKRE